MPISNTPKPPYYAVIFTSIKLTIAEGYAEMADRMVELAQEQQGFLGMETANGNIGITVSYWESLEAIKSWKANSEHLFAQQKGRADWYKAYKARICKVERDYDFEK